MGEDNITREEISLMIELSNERTKGEIMGNVIKNENDIQHNGTGIDEIKDDVKSIRDILRGRDKLLIGTLVSSVATVITLAVTIILVLVK